MAEHGNDPLLTAEQRALLLRLYMAALETGCQAMYRTAVQEGAQREDVLRAAAEAALVLKVPTAQAGKGPRVWVLPHLFGDVVLHTPTYVSVRVRCEKVLQAWKENAEHEQRRAQGIEQGLHGVRVRQAEA